MPDLGTMPFKHAQARKRQVPRLVSAMDDISLSIELQHGTNRIGRQRKDNQIVLASPQISRFHAEIDVTVDQVILRDLGSANGSRVNGERLSGERVLQAGDLLTFANAFALRLSVDISLEKPVTQRLDNVAAPGERPAGVHTPDIPRSLEKRLGESQDIILPPPNTPPLAVRVTPVKAIELPLRGAGDAGERPSSRRPASRRTTREVPQQQPLPMQQSLPLAERQVALLYQLSQRCLSAQSLDDLDGLLINVLERTVAFDRGFMTYQLPGGDWKLIMSPRGVHWQRHDVSFFVQLAMRQRKQISTDASVDPRLGGIEDFRILNPLRSGPYVVGAIYLQSAVATPFEPEVPEFLTLFADIAANAILRCAQLQQYS